MKKITLIFVIVFSVLNFGFAQNVAQNWTKTDCAGTAHTLYDYLDSNQVVIMEFSMGCSSCLGAIVNLQNIKNEFELTNPGKVKLVFMDYWAGHTCSNTVQPSMTTNNINCPAFEHCLPEKSYYSSASPMPMVVIAAGCNHDVIYKREHFMLSDTADIKDSINLALLNVCTTSINEKHKSNANITVFPNPATDKLYVNFNNLSDENYSCVITDLMGNQVKKIVLNPINYSANIDVKGIPVGVYFLKLTSSKQDLVKRFCIVE